MLDDVFLFKHATSSNINTTNCLRVQLSPRKDELLILKQQVICSLCNTVPATDSSLRVQICDVLQVYCHRRRHTS